MITMINNYTCEEVFDALILADATCCRSYKAPPALVIREHPDLMRGLEWLRACADNPYNDAQTALWNVLQAATEMIFEGRDHAPKAWQYARPANDEDDILI